MKKNSYTPGSCHSSWRRKTLLAMKLTAFFLFAGLFAAIASNSLAQVGKVTIDMENSSLSSVFDEIEAQTSYALFYKKDVIDDQRAVSIDVEEEELSHVLNQLLAKDNVSYQVMDNSIVIVPSKFSNIQQQEERTVEGVVMDEEGDPIPGVTVSVKGTTQGTITNQEGNFSLPVAEEAEILVFSFVGMQTQEVSIGDKTRFEVRMKEEILGLDEVVVVGFGTQQKANLTGAVSTANVEELERKTSSQVSQALAGATSGITVSQGSGEPGADMGSIRIRGLGTFSDAGKEPLVLIDGIEGNINNVNPNNIANVSVLKDAASASIYGSRAANGVILIETKEGKSGEMQVSYDSYVGVQEAVELPEYVDSWVYAEMKNEALFNMGKGAEFTQEDIEKFKSGEYPDEYPNKHHARDFFNSGNGIQTKHNLTFSGGTDKTQFLFSSGYLKQNGIIEQVGYDRHNMRLNVNSQLHDKLKLNVKLSGTYSIKDEPALAENSEVLTLESIQAFANWFPATVPGEKSDGYYGEFNTHPSPRAALDSEGFSKRKDYTFQNNVSLEWNIINSLKLTGKMGYNAGFSKDREYGAEFQVTPYMNLSPSALNVESSNSEYLDLQLYMDYDKTFGDHYLHVLGGISRQEDNMEYLGAYRKDFPSTKLHFLDAGSTEDDRNWGTGETWKLESYFGRLNYSFQDKYLLEGNLRYDGSSRFGKGNRFGLFPSMSAGWVLSEEDFFQVPGIERLKIRGSYGVLGNQEIGTYPYQKTLSLGHSYPLGADPSMQPGAQLTTLPFDNISWETTNVTDIGVDINLFRGKVNFVADYYHKKTYDILYGVTVANIIGKDVSEQNAGEVENKGWDFELTYKNKKGDFSYSISPNFSINHNEVLKLGMVDRDIEQGLFVGESLSAIYGYETDGLFVDETDVENYPDQQIYDARPGMIRYKDISGPDGEPDGVVDPENDRTIIGDGFPTYTYGMGITADYKGFDFFLQMQGLGGHDRVIGQGQTALYNDYNIQKWHVENRWTQENPDRNAEYPRLEQLGIDVPWGTMNSEYWMRDASFLRIKNVQLGYSIPSRFLNNSFINKCRVYLSGQNVYTFDSYYPGYDPEMNVEGWASGQYYPATRLWSVGLNVQF